MGLPGSTAWLLETHCLRHGKIYFYLCYEVTEDFYPRQDEAGTPYCLTIDGQTLDDKTITLRDRDSLEQVRIKLDDAVEEVERRVNG